MQKEGFFEMKCEHCRAKIKTFEFCSSVDGFLLCNRCSRKRWASIVKSFGC